MHPGNKHFVEKSIWKTSKNISTKDTGLGIYIADIVSKNKIREKIQFTFC